MFEAKAMLYLYVETPLHAGSGTSLGVVDLPVQRERVTNYPMVQASGLKGKLRAEASEWAEKQTDTWDAKKKVKVVFGPEAGPGASDHAGAFSPGDARLLLFPVRSMIGVFAWTTSRDALARFCRDARTTGVEVNWQPVGPTAEDKALVAPGNDVVAEGKVVLEEFAFDATEDEHVRVIADWLASNAMPQESEYAYWRQKLSKSLIVLSENAFRDFTQFSTEIINRIRLNHETKTVAEGALWSEEHLPTDTLFYAPLFATRPRVERDELPQGWQGTAKEVLEFVRNLGLVRIQLGGDETVGRGLVRVRFS
mgnify:CR=1 FL=1